jgi:cytochrome c biogenesis protein CcmG/thiol:disulfide interchange protein DsbE
MPLLAAAARRLDGQVAFLGIDYQDTREEALAFVEETGVRYPSGVDEDGAVGRRYGLYGLPTTVFVSAEGQIAGRHLGEMSEETLDRFLDQLLAAR